jgi:exopolyphosphatase/guanosine-5'-triphosphate,3'-diphosphate pyrophosphatase
VGEQIESAVLNRLKVWASFLDPDFKHSRHVARLALQLYDGISADAHGDHEREKERSILEAAALLRDVGLSKRKKGHQKASYRMIEKLQPPLGWTKEKLNLVAAVSRYHRGALPRPGQKALAQIVPSHRQLTLKLAGILRLANAFDADHSGRIHGLDASAKDGRVVVAAQGYNPRDRMAESIAAARHLLETVSRRPIVVKAFTNGARSRRARK